MSDDWTPEDLEIEAALLNAEPGTYVEVHGVVVSCSKDGLRSAMNAADFHRLRKEMTRPKGTTAKKE